MTKDNAIIARAAYPNLYESLYTPGSYSREERLQMIDQMAADARAHGWRIKDGQAYLPPDKREAFYRAIGLIGESSL